MDFGTQAKPEPSVAGFVVGVVCPVLLFVAFVASTTGHVGIIDMSIPRGVVGGLGAAGLCLAVVFMEGSHSTKLDRVMRYISGLSVARGA